MTNYYKILGVRDFGTPDEIKTAYRKLSKKFHPDVNEGDKFFEERFKEIQNAYEVLTTPHRKIAHDSSLKSYTEKTYRPSATQPEPPPPPPKKEPTQAGTSAHTQSAPPKSSPNKSEHFSYSGIFVVVLIGIATFFIYLALPKTNHAQLEAQSSTQQLPKPEESYLDTTAVIMDTTYAPAFSQTRNISKDDYSKDNQEVPTVSPAYFTLNSSKEQVLAVQGNPTTINSFEALNEEIWYYGLSSVTFKSGKVNEYSDHGHNLKIKLNVIGSTNQTSHFSMGSSKNEVLLAQGRPTSINKFEALNEEIWYYGLSSVTLKYGKVTEYANHSHNLRIVLEVSEAPIQRNFYSIGSSTDEVLQIQGAPTSINKFEALDEEIWYYGLSSVTFKFGKVKEYANHGRNLKISF